MSLTSREIHWRLKKMTARINAKNRFQAGLAGIEIPDHVGESNANEELSPEAEAMIARQLAATQERLKARGGSSS